MTKEEIKNGTEYFIKATSVKSERTYANDISYSEMEHYRGDWSTYWTTEKSLAHKFSLKQALKEYKSRANYIKLEVKLSLVRVPKG